MPEGPKSVIQDQKAEIQGSRCYISFHTTTEKQIYSTKRLEFYPNFTHLNLDEPMLFFQK